MYIQNHVKICDSDLTYTSRWDFSIHEILFLKSISSDVILWESSYKRHVSYNNMPMQRWHFLWTENVKYLTNNIGNSHK